MKRTCCRLYFGSWCHVLFHALYGGDASGVSADFISETDKQMKRSGQKNMLRTVNVKEVTAAIKEMCIEANHFLSDDMAARMKKAVDEE